MIRAMLFGDRDRSSASLAGYMCNCDVTKFDLASTCPCDILPTSLKAPRSFPCLLLLLCGITAHGCIHSTNISQTPIDNKLTEVLFLDSNIYVLAHFRQRSSLRLISRGIISGPLGLDENGLGEAWIHCMKEGNSILNPVSASSTPHPPH
jgi:hypothetical protein